MCGDAEYALSLMRDFHNHAPEYVFGRLAFSAALACDNRADEAASVQRSIEHQQIHTEGFFKNLSQDLTRAGQDKFAVRVASIVHEHESSTV
jgi:hypothetical protein